MIIKTVESVESRFKQWQGGGRVVVYVCMHNIRSDQINSYRDRDGLVLMSRSSRGTHWEDPGLGSVHRLSQSCFSSKI